MWGGVKRGKGVFPRLSPLDMSRVVTVTTYSPDSLSTKEGEAVKSFRKTNVCSALVPFKIIPLIATAGGVWESSANSRLICVCAGWDIILSHCVEFPWRCVALSWRTEPCGLVLPHRRSGASLPGKERRLARVNHTRRCNFANCVSLERR